MFPAIFRKLTLAKASCVRREASGSRVAGSSGTAEGLKRGRGHPRFFQESKRSRRHPSPAVWGRGRRPLRGTSKRPSGERASPSQTGSARGSAPRNLAGTAEQAGFAVLDFFQKDTDRWMISAARGIKPPASPDARS